jgi:hypothetical protein
MAFELKNTVPWGRNLDEYKSMFSLTISEMDKDIVSFGDGPASFNAEMTKYKKRVISIDPIYQFSEKELRQRIDETKDIVIKQTRNNLEKFIWTKIRDIRELEQTRMSAMDKFFQDFEIGKSQGRYISHEMPNRTAFEDMSFDLGLSSHFLVLYSQLGLDFHIASMTEMLRICREIRIFPILNLNAVKSELLEDLIKHFETDYQVTIEKVDYEFQKNGTEMLKIKRL